MSNYTPPTNEVRNWYALGQEWRESDRRAEFDRWLAGLRGEALRDAADWLDSFEGPGGRSSAHDRAGRDIIAQLRRRAEKLARGES